MTASHSDLRRLLERVTVSEGGCWEHGGSLGSHGYPNFSTAQHGVGTAHRIGWMLMCGAIPDGMLVLHECNNKRCVRPGEGHLYLGTHVDNMEDVSRSKGHPSRKLNGRVGLVKILLGAGWSQRRVARAMGVNQRTIWRIANGRTYRHG